MHFKILLLCAFVATLAFAQRGWEQDEGNFMRPTLRTQSVFKSDFEYTFAYEADMKTMNPIVKDQSTGIKFKTSVKFNFLPRGSGYFKTRMTLTKPVFSTYTINPTPSFNVPTQKTLEIKDEIIEHLQKEMYFHYKDGVVLRIFPRKNEPFWITNLKRGIVNLLSVDVFGKIGNEEQTMFKKLEKTVLGICNCTYTVEESDDMFMNVTKTIDGEECRTDRNMFYSTLNAEEDSEEQDATNIRKQTTIDYQLVRTRLNTIKILSANATGTTMLYMLQDKREPITGITNQTLRLVKEEKLDKPDFEFPDWKAKDLMFYLPNQKVHPSQMTYDESRRYADVVYKILLDISKSYIDFNQPLNKEFAYRIIQVVNMLRPLRHKHLNLQWQTCMQHPKVKHLFMRVFSMIRTTDSARLMDRKIRDKSPDLSPELLGIYFDMLSSQSHVERQMITLTKDMCSYSMVRKNDEIQIKCFMAAVILRKKFCGKKLCLWLQQPTDFRRALEIRQFITFSTDKRIRYLQIAEEAEDQQLIDSIIAIIRDNNMCKRTRKHAILSLRPLLRRVGNRIVNALMELLRTQETPEEIRQTIYMVLLESPTPSIIHACAHQMATESSMTNRRYVFEMLLSLSKEKEPLMGQESQKACRVALDFLRNRKLVPISLRWYKQHFSSVIQPLSGSNVKLFWKTQLHQTNTSLVPKSVFSQLNMKFFGQQFNIFDAHVEMDGVQEFLSRLSGVISKKESPVTPPENAGTQFMTLFGNMKLFGQNWVSESRRIRHDDSQNKYPSGMGKYYTWKEIAQSLNNGYKFESKKMFMPMESIVRVPTCVGFPLVFDLSTMLVSKMENFVQTRSPSLLDIPYFFFSTVDIKAEFIHKQRLVFFMRGSAFFDSPIIKAGFHHNKTMNISMDLQFSVKTNMKTLESTTTFEMPKLPELISMEGETEMFVMYFDKDSQNHLKFNYHRIPVSFDQSMDKYDFFATDQDTETTSTNRRREFDSSDVKQEENHSTFTLKVANTRRTKYLSTSSGNVVVKDASQKWKIIPTRANSKIVSLYVPDSGYIFVDDSLRKNLKISKDKRSYFMVDSTPEGTLTFRTLVPAKQSTKPSNWEEILENVSIMLAEMQKTEMKATEEMKRAYKMINEDYVSNVVNVMYITFNENDQSIEMTEKQLQTSHFISQLQQPSSSFYKSKLYQNKRCYSDWFPVCIHGIWSRDTVSMKAKSFFFEPMMWRLRTTTSKIEKIQIRVEPSGISENKKYTLTVSPVGPNRPKTLQMTWSHDTRSRKFSFDIFPDTSTSSDRFMCFRFEYPTNTIRSSLSFEKNCQTKFFEVYNINHHLVSLFSMNFKWIVRYDDSIPISTKKMIFDFYNYVIGSFVNTKSLTRQMRPFGPEKRKSDDDHDDDQTTIQGDGSLYLRTPSTIRIQLNNSRHEIRYIVSLPTAFERFPFGSKQYSFAQQSRQLLEKPTCMHRRNVFKTFDQFSYKYQIPDSKCEHVLVKTCSVDIPTFEVLVKEADDLKHLRIKMDESEITIVPNQFNTIPEININRQSVSISTTNPNGYTYTLPNKMTLQFYWIEETKSLFLLNEKLGLELLIVASRTIHVRLSNMLFGRVCGLCGDMNAEQAMEMRTPEGIEVEDQMTFGMSWLRTSDTCKSGECPFERQKTQMLIGGKRCYSRIELPKCFSKCRVTKRVDLQKVPFECRDTSSQEIDFKIATVEIPVKCQCSC